MAAQNGSVTTKTQPAVSSPVQSSTIQQGQLRMSNGVLQGDQPFNMNQLSQYTNQLMAMNSASPVFPSYTPSIPSNRNTHPNLDICGMLTTLIHKVDRMDSKLTQLDAIQNKCHGQSAFFWQTDQYSGEKNSWRSSKVVRMTVLC